jgi:hypothetical protein
VTISVTKAKSIRSAAKALDEAVPLEDGERVILEVPVGFHKPYADGLVSILRSLIEVSARGHLRLTDRRLVLLHIKGTGSNLAYSIPRSLIRGVAPAGGGFLRLVCAADGLPAGLTGIKAGVTAGEAGLAGGAGAAGGVLVSTSRANRADTLKSVLTAELGTTA